MTLLLPLAAMAQVTINVDSPVLVRPGRPVDFLMTLAVSAGPPPAGVQWKLAFPAGLGTLTSVTLGAAADAALKEVHCTDDWAKCLLAGMNQNTIQSGPLARFTLQVQPAATPGLYQIPITELLGSTPDAQAQELVIGTALQVRVLHRADLNGDGHVNRDDLDLMLKQALGMAACTDDQNGDSRCDLLDVVYVVYSALGPRPGEGGN